MASSVPHQFDDPDSVLIPRVSKSHLGTRTTTFESASGAARVVVAAALSLEGCDAYYY